MSLTLISTVTVGSGGAATIDFNSIAGTYTDLHLVMSLRSTTTNGSIYIKFNGSSTGYSVKMLNGNGSSASSTGGTSQPSVWLYGMDETSLTGNTFSSHQIYIPNYAGTTQNKTFSFESMQEHNAAYSLSAMGAGLWANTAAITSISLTADAAYGQYSSASLYGITKGSGGATVSP